MHAALAGRGFGIARATAEEAKEHNEALAKEGGNPRRMLNEGELVAVNSFGNVYRFDEHTTGQFRGEIDKRLAGFDAAKLLSIADATDFLPCAMTDVATVATLASRPRPRRGDPLTKILLTFLGKS